MDVEQLKANHTRKEMDELAANFDIDEPEHYPNKTELGKAIINAGYEEEETVEDLGSPPKRNRPYRCTACGGRYSRSFFIGKGEDVRKIPCPDCGKKALR